MKASCDMFSQILKLITRPDFERIVKETGAEYRSKGLSSWGQFVAMLFCQLGRAHSLLEIEGRLKNCEGKLAHLGIEAPARSSLSYANSHRPWELFEKVFYGLFETVAAKAVNKKKFRFKNKLVSIDSTVIDLCVSMYDWAKFRTTKGAVNIGTSFAANKLCRWIRYCPNWLPITAEKILPIALGAPINVLLITTPITFSGCRVAILRPIGPPQS